METELSSFRWQVHLFQHQCHFDNFRWNQWHKILEIVDIFPFHWHEMGTWDTVCWQLNVVGILIQTWMINYMALFYAISLFIQVLILMLVSPNTFSNRAPSTNMAVHLRIGELQTTYGNSFQWYGARIVAQALIVMRHDLLSKIMIGLVSGMISNGHQANDKYHRSFMESVEDNAVLPIKSRG